MHDRRSRTVLDVSDIHSALPQNVLKLADLVRFLRLRRWAILVPILTALVAAYGYIQIAIPMYTARAQIIIDPRLPQFIPGRSEESLLAWDSAQVESEIAVLQSERIAEAVVVKLGLDRANDFRTVPTVLGRVLSILMPRRPLQVSTNDRRRNALSLIESGLTVRRTGLSYAIDITFAFPDPLRATEIANNVAEAYIADQIENRSQAARIGGEWLQKRMVLLKAQMNSAAQAVQLFRASHNYTIPRLGPGSAASNGDKSGEAPITGAASEDKTLDELEASASTYRRIYESFLQSFTESVQRQSFPVSDARILTPASLPKFKSAPRVVLIFALSALLGSLLGFGIAILQQHVDDTVHSSGQVAMASGLDDLGTLPRFRYGTVVSLLEVWARRLLNQRPGRKEASGDLIRRQVASERRFWQPGVGPYFAEIADARGSPFRSALMTLKVLIDLEGRRRPVKSLAITAPRHQSGTSTLASHLATFFADGDTKTLLIDADVQGRELTKRVVPNAGTGLLQVLAQSATIEKSVVSFQGTKLDFLPATGGDDVGDHVLDANAMERLLKDVTGKYDLVILDLPPVLPVGEAVAISPFVDGVILVVDEGTTSANAVTSSAAHLDRARATTLGFVLSKATG